MVFHAEDSQPGGIDGNLQMVAEPKGLWKWGHKLGSETGSRITSENGLGTSALWLVVVVRALTTCKSLKGNVSTTRSCYLARCNHKPQEGGSQAGHKRRELYPTSGSKPKMENLGSSS